MNGLGASGPVVFQKPIANLGKDYIVRVLFRSISVVASGGPDDQAQLWLYDTAHVSIKDLWQAYYLRVFFPWAKRIRAILSTSPMLTPALEPRAHQYPIGTMVHAERTGSKLAGKKRSKTSSGPFRVVKAENAQRWLQEPVNHALLPDIYLVSELSLATPVGSAELVGFEHGVRASAAAASLASTWEPGL